MKRNNAFGPLLITALFVAALLVGCSSEPADGGSAAPASTASADASQDHWTDALTPLSVEQVRERIDKGTEDGKAMLVCLWSVNCPACVEELPVLEQLADQFSLYELEVLLLNLDMDKNVVRNFFQDYEPASTVLLVEPEVGNEFRATYIPKLVLFDAKGEIAFEDSGFYPKPMLEALINRAIAAE